MDMKKIINTAEQIQEGVNLTEGVNIKKEVKNGLASCNNISKHLKTIQKKWDHIGDGEDDFADDFFQFIGQLDSIEEELELFIVDMNEYNDND